MRFLLIFDNPWCLFSLLLLIFLLLAAAALLSLSRQRQRLSAPRPDRRRDITATAPVDALVAMYERLTDIERHLPPDSDDARWLAGYLHDLRSVLDEVYQELEDTSGAARASLLERLSVEVARLDGTINTRLSTRIGAATDRDALHAQLDQLRRSINRP